ncbi:hypothetical protein ENHY17A_100373 [Moraxellaceae bacterium 17A]|nr:hypothetical protein ENHY17A_100373 [Moraxellaceae bacterium 17A]
MILTTQYNYSSHKYQILGIL